MNENVHLKLLSFFQNNTGLEVNQFKKVFYNYFIEGESEKYFLSNPNRGVYVPKQQNFVLSIIINSSQEPYQNQIFYDNTLQFKEIIYKGPSNPLDVSSTRDNNALRNCYYHRIPFGIIQRVRKGIYKVLGLGIIVSYEGETYTISPYNLLLQQKIRTSNNTLTITEKTSELKSRIGQASFRKGLISKQKCELCEINRIDLLIASHIKPWSLSNDEERLDPENGLLLCPIHDKLFDQGFITIQDNKIIISDLLQNHPNYNLDLKKSFYFTYGQMHYLQFHNNVIFKK